MRCDSIKDWFNDYLDGDLTRERKEAVDNHLEQCSHCRREFNKLKQADDFLRLEVRRMFAEIPLPEGLQSKIDDEIKKRGRRLPFYKRLQRGYAGIAAALLIFAAAYGMFHQQFGGRPDSNVMNGESLPEATEQASPPEAADQSQVYQLDADEDVQPVITEDPVGESNPDVQKQSANIKKSSRVMEKLPAETLVGDADSATGINPCSFTETSLKKEEPAKRANEIEGAAAAENDAAATSAGKEIDKVNADNKLVPLLPSYLPEGTVMESLSRSENTVNINYKAGNLIFGIEERLAPEANVSEDSPAKGKEIKINGQSGTLLESTPPGRFTVIFQQDRLLITIEGTLPVEEILSIAESLR